MRVCGQRRLGRLISLSIGAVILALAGAWQTSAAWALDSVAGLPTPSQTLPLYLGGMFGSGGGGSSDSQDQTSSGDLNLTPSAGEASLPAPEDTSSDQAWDLLSQYVPEAGQWQLVPGTAFDAARLGDTQAADLGIQGSVGSRAVLSGQTGAAYDAEGHFWYLWGGEGYGGNEVYRLDLEILQTTQVTAPSLLDTVVEGCAVPSDGPSASPTYDGIVWVPSTQTFFVFPAGGFCPGGSLTPQSVWEFDPASATWQAVAALGAEVGPVFAEYDPFTDLIVVIIGGAEAKIREFDPATGQLSAPIGLGLSLTSGTAVLRPGSAELFVVSQEGIFSVSLSDLGTVQKLDDLEAGVDPQSGAAFHPGSGRLVLWDGSGTVWTYEPVSSNWAEFAGNGPTEVEGGVFSKWIYLEALDAFAGYHNPAEGLWLYRLSEEVATASEPTTTASGTEEPTNSAPVADAGADQSLQVGETATLDGSGSFDPDGDALTYSWSLVTKPTGSTASLSNASAVNPSLTLDVAGTFVAQLVVHDGLLASVPDTVEINALDPSTDPNQPVIINGTQPANYVWDTLAVGKSVYIDRSYTYTAVPTELESVAVLRTANDDKSSSGDAFITFSIDNAATVYVAHDTEISTKPTWLSGWTDTGAVLQTTDTALELYRRDFEAGTVTLGGNGGGSSSSMYTVVVDIPGFDSSESSSDSGSGSDSGGGIADRVIADPTLVVDLDNPRWLRYASGERFFMCGPGDPEDFLYRGSRNADGTRTGDQMELINKLAATGANSIYMQIIRSHGGDGVSSHNPFVDSDPALGLDEDILNQWESWFTAMDEAGIVIYLFFFDDSANIWGGGDTVPAAERDFIETIVNRFKHHNRLIWVIAEEYQEAFSTARVSNMAAIIRAADANGHAIAVHKLSGLSFGEFANDPNMDQFAIQYNNKSAPQLHSGMVQAFEDAAGRYNLNMAETSGHGAGETARKKNWAIAMGGAYVMVFQWDIAGTAVSDLEDCGNLVDFMESTNFDEMEPSDELAFGGAEYVLAGPSSYILYASALADEIGVRGIASGTYNLRWLDIATGAVVEQTGVEVAGGDVTWARPAGIGTEVAVWVALAGSIDFGTADETTDGSAGEVTNTAPVADVGADITGNVGETVVLDGGGSFDPDGDALTYSWSLQSKPAGSTATLSNPSTKTPSLMLDLAGSFEVSLVVSDGNASSTADLVTITALAVTSDSGGTGSGTDSESDTADTDTSTNVLDSLPAGTWYEAPDTHLRAVEKKPHDWPDWDGSGSASYDSYQRNTGVRGLIAAWNSGAYDPIRHRLIVWGGGHNDYGGNELYAFDIDTLAWQRVTDPTPSPQRGGDGVNSDGTPISRHTYGGLAYITHADRLFAKGGAPDSESGGCSTPGTWTFDFSQNQWRLMNPAGDFGNEGCESKSIYDPVSKKVYFFNNNSGWSRPQAYDYDSNTFTVVGPDVAYVARGKTLVVDVQRRILYSIGGGSNDEKVLDLTSDPLTAQIITMGGDTTIADAVNPGIAYDPLTGKLVGWYGGSHLYAMDPETLVWAKITPASENSVVPPQVSASGGVYGRFRYVPSKDVFVMVNSVDENVFLFKPDRTSGPLAADEGTTSSSSPTPAPTVTFSASPTSIVVGESASLNWSSTNATSCTASDGWSGTKATTGSEVVTPTVETIYSLTCTGDGGSSPTASVIVTVSDATETGSLPLGTLVHDGPATPEQISLYLPVTGSLPKSATATVRYKRADSQTWTTGHPLLRIHPEFSTSPDVGSVPDAFAWPIIDLEPGASYDVEVTVTSSSTSDVRTARFTTRALPDPAGTPNKTLLAGASGDMVQTELNNLVAGDVMVLQNGTYNVDSLQLKRSGTLDSPIYIRGESRDGVILSDPNGSIFQILDASHVVIENMTLQGSGTDSGTGASSVGVSFWDGAPNQTRFTIRHVTIKGVDKGIVAWNELFEFLAYDNTLVGNNTWTTDLIDTNATWNDDGIRIPGFGNAAFNNSLTGFGDTFSYAAHSGGDTNTESVGVHFYRNDARNSGDDLTEVDHGHRNLTFYDNRSHNSMTFISLDPLYGGPFIGARNVAINVGRSPFKWNNTNTGQFVYNNTIVRTTGRHWVSGNLSAEAGWYQPNNGAQEVYGYRNNILVYRGAGNQTIRLDNLGHDTIDFTHNSWYPNLVYQWSEGRFSGLEAAYNSLSETKPVFGGITRRHERDNITGSNPWTDTVALGPDYRTEVMETYTPTLLSGTAPKNSGVIIPNITDGFSGTAPDRGAIISGRATPLHGDRSMAAQ